MKIHNIEEVSAFQLCCGCGICAYLNPKEINMIDTLEFGRRPKFKNKLVENRCCKQTLEACPGIGISYPFNPYEPGLVQELFFGWGPVLEVWEGHAVDNEIHFKGSSGGVATSLSLYCLEKEKMSGILHVGARNDVPYLTQTLFSKSREDLLKGIGSRYAPASPCEGLHKIEEAKGPCVFIGKPCDVAGVKKLKDIRSNIQDKLGLTISIFCAGTPSCKGTLEIFDTMGIKDYSSVTNVRYRGFGWPGKTHVIFKKEDKLDNRELTYEQTWGNILQKHRQWRCYICPDHTGEFADISVGDPWYRSFSKDDLGRTLVIVRTQLGMNILRKSMENGYLNMKPVSFEVLPESQKNLLQVRGAVWGRIMALKIMGAPVPRFSGMSLFHIWWKHLNLKQKLQSFFGTIKRVFRKKLKAQCEIEELIT